MRMIAVYFGSDKIFEMKIMICWRWPSSIDGDDNSLLLNENGFLKWRRPSAINLNDDNDSR